MVNKYKKPEYTKEDIEAFNKIVNTYFMKNSAYGLYEAYYNKTRSIQLHLTNNNYYGYVLDIAYILDRISDTIDTTNQVAYDMENKTKHKEISFEKLIRAPLEEMPLLINEQSLIGKLATWRLKIGK